MARKSAIETNQLTDTIYYILLCLTRPSHGYALMAEIEALSEGALCVGPASMYTTLKKLVDSGLICLADKDSKTYEITPEGREKLLADYERRKATIRHSERMLQGAGGGPDAKK